MIIFYLTAIIIGGWLGWVLPMPPSLAFPFLIIVALLWLNSFNRCNHD